MLAPTATTHTGARYNRYTTASMLVPTATPPRRCLFQPLHHRVNACSNRYTTASMLVPTATPPRRCLFQPLHHRAGACSNRYTTALMLVPTATPLPGACFSRYTTASSMLHYRAGAWLSARHFGLKRDCFWCKAICFHQKLSKCSENGSMFRND